MAGSRGDPMAESARRARERRERWERQGERPAGRNLAMVGVLGWLIVTPALLGLAVGRWLDGAAGSGILWSGALLVVGLALGCAIAWRWMHEQ